VATVLTAGAVVTGAVDGAVVVSTGSGTGTDVAADDVAGGSAVSDDGAALSMLDGVAVVGESPDDDASAEAAASVAPSVPLTAVSFSRSDSSATGATTTRADESVGDPSSGTPSTVSPSGTAGAVVGATSANSVAASTSVVVDASAAPLDPSGDVPAQAVAMNAATSPTARCLRLPGRVGRRVRMGAPWTLEEGALPINRCVPASWMFLGTVVAEYWVPGI